MKSRIYSTFWISILFYFSFPSAVKAQILNDADTKEQVIQALKHIYNFEFKEAEPYQQRIKNKYPAHPVNPLLEAIQTFWQYLPVVENGSAATRYQNYLNQSLQQAEKLKDANKHDTEATFFLLATHSYLAMLESDRGEFMKAGAEAKRTYSYMRKGFKLLEQNPEFYFSTGLYNYYREQYPQDHPVVRPIMFFFQDGNKNLGLKQMETGYQKGIFTKTEAAYYLTYVLIKHENNPQRALSYSTPLYKEYSDNPIYVTRHAEALTLSGRYGEAEPLAQQLAQKKHYVFKTAGEVFIGLILEKGKKNDAAASAYYQKAVLNRMSEQYTQDYHAMAYCGLARIAERNGQSRQAKDYYHKAQKLAEYSSTIQEIKRALK